VIWWRGQDCLFLEEIEFDPETSRMASKRTIVFDDGRLPWEQFLEYCDYNMPQVYWFNTHPAQCLAKSIQQHQEHVNKRPVIPTGAAYTRDELSAFGEVLGAHPRVLVATDEIYEHVYWGQEPFCSFVSACPDLYERTITIPVLRHKYRPARKKLVTRFRRS